MIKLRPLAAAAKLKIERSNERPVCHRSQTSAKTTSKSEPNSQRTLTVFNRLVRIVLGNRNAFWLNQHSGSSFRAVRPVTGEHFYCLAYQLVLLSIESYWVVATSQAVQLSSWQTADALSCQRVPYGKTFWKRIHLNWIKDGERF